MFFGVCFRGLADFWVNLFRWDIFWIRLEVNLIGKNVFDPMSALSKVPFVCTQFYTFRQFLILVQRVAPNFHIAETSSKNSFSQTFCLILKGIIFERLFLCYALQRVFHWASFESI